MEVSSTVIEGCKRGDAEAFEQLVRASNRDVYSLALRLTGNPDDAAEVTQETYMKLLRSIGSFRGEAKFSTWLYRVTSNVAITAMRKRSRRRLDVSLETVDWENIPTPSDPAAEVERRQLRHRLDRAISSLPAGYRAVVVMKDVYGLSLDHIGKQLGITEGAAKVRLFRARQRLKGMLHDEGTTRVQAKERRGSNGVS